MRVLGDKLSGNGARERRDATFADLAASTKIILPEVEWRKRPVRKGAPLDAGHRVTLARWTVMKPVQPLEMEANYPDDSHQRSI
jgi:hypothetical protein